MFFCDIINCGNLFPAGYEMNTVNYLILAVGILCLIYYGIIICYAGIGAAFSRFWLFTGISCVLLYISKRYMTIKNITLPWQTRLGAIIILLGGICTFVIIEGLIIYHSVMKAKPDAEYLIVLGARIRGTKITRSLYMRLKTAKEYLKDNHKTLVIVSGGQGPGEDVPEAQVMKIFLQENGIEEKRILVEDKSKNTLENILYSKKLLCKDDAGVVVVTSGFHIFRSLCIAKKQGLKNVQGLSAPCDRILLVNYYVREAFGVIKDFLYGNM